MDSSQQVISHKVLELKVDIGRPVTIGESDKGTRRYIPITGGTFQGESMNGDAWSGEVIPGGADWQLTRPDGVTEIEAIYAIRTEDGAVISVRNRGIAVDLTDQEGREVERYVRTNPQFQAPAGKYDWLNKRQFVGTITVGPDRSYVVIGVYQVL